ncbi:putative nucleoside permease NupX [Fusobacterium sp. DD29]|uniref:NupC/NupG family nucleoside CNT transporter n=1 Tax=unclassified Fusobacterium TaxID=2648384 RepID=UPI001B8BD561|nr:MULTISPECIES: nucleoside transporter C-terminal domain-containing protein [unclassified Fusobacterium]MBR8700978.1 putative nucleoside permease NupX [Fusobacterium sp. DD45]MBR8710834.1 putative nucleoside permease NupX [Fusobacterium sp. DD28]MBR8748489.1 putative nucleoside permease NupX [Fusobacterium sp. DD29]MBR8751309.1 putative nucleoside permease NupX [Fusobacterium sp. DD26]MBR8760756.1 putative nucleoside permease NupX [Fusobacterium sp. DD25]
MKGIITLVGIVLLLGLMYLISSKKKDVKINIVIKAMIAQFIIAILLVKFPYGRIVVSKISDVVTEILNYGINGLSFVFGSLADPGQATGFIFMVVVLGNIVFLSAFVAALFYLGILGFIVKVIGKVVGKFLGTSQVESFVAVANMFLGQTESPILVSKYLGNMTQSEIMVVLVSGMGSMSATIIGGYVALGIPMEYLLIASSLVPLGSIAISKILLPETEKAKIVENVSMDRKGHHENIISAISEGAVSGMNTAIAIAASLIAFISLIALVNGILGIFGLSLEKIFSYVFSPLGFFMGLDGNNIFLAGELLGYKLVLNEFIAFQKLGQLIQALDYRTGLIISIALAGFANFSSMGICISGISVLCPDKRRVLARLAFKAMIGGFAVSVLSAMIVAFITSF